MFVERIFGRLSRAAILMYHRVAEVPYDPWGLAVSPANFAAQLDLLKRHRVVLPMDEFARLHCAGRLPRRACAITFDDGYLDNLNNAAPLLTAAGLPATLFLSTGPMFGEGYYWFEELAAMLLDAPAPVEIAVPLARGSPLVISFGAREAADEDRHEWRAWGAPRTARETVFHAAWNRLRPLSLDDRTEAIAALRQATGVVADAAARPMRVAEVRALPANFSLGGHTVDHVDLLIQSRDAALDQIARGKADVERIFGRSITGFAYPFGNHNEPLAGLVCEAGFAWACTTVERNVRPGADPYRLPRFAALDQPDIEWAG